MTVASILNENDDLMKQVEAQGWAIKDLIEMEKRFLELEAKNDPLRNTKDNNIQEIKKDVHYELLEEFKARKEAVELKEKEVRNRWGN